MKQDIQHDMQHAIATYASLIGRDPLLIQGAGGNISWKDGNVLWIKASGTWLAEADTRDIFIPLDLAQTRALVARGASDFHAARIGDSTLRPSIETSLHALLTHRIVVHVHAVDVIALAVLQQAPALLQELLAGLAWAWVEYAKPGAELAQAVARAMASQAQTDILLLANHGLVIGADSIEECELRLADVLRRCAASIRQAGALGPEAATDALREQALLAAGYQRCQDPVVQQLAHDPLSLSLAREKWVMYPDHAVFLGALSPVMEAQESLPDFFQRLAGKPVCIIMAQHGVMLRTDCTPAQEAMLACYAAVTARIKNVSDVVCLTAEQIAALLNWDAEKYRQSLSEKKH